MARYKITRDFYTGKDAKPHHTDPDLGVEVYYSEKTHTNYQTGKEVTRYTILAFAGKRQKPDLHYYYTTAEARDAKLQDWLSGLEASRKFKQEQRARREVKAGSVSVGDIFYTSWGYEQTNIDFYEVVEVSSSGKSVKIRQIASKQIEATGWASATVVAQPGVYLDDKILTKRIQAYNDRVHLTIESYAHAWPWDGEPKYSSWYH